ncbi:MAG: hypothetical protein V1747_10965 [Candidatus Omnitrophota bacterium]
MRLLIISAMRDENYDLTWHPIFTSKAPRMHFKEQKKIIEDNLETTHNRLIQNKLILLVTIFESFLKDIHKEIIIQNPSILKNNKQIASSKLISPGKNKIIMKKIIDKEVYSLDRKNSEEKARYFKDKLGIDWFEGKIVPLLRHVIKVRNVILHEDHEYKVSEFEIGLAFMICQSIPYVTVAQAAILYPKGFKLPLGLTRERAKQFCKKSYKKSP